MTFGVVASRLPEEVYGEFRHDMMAVRCGRGVAAVSLVRPQTGGSGLWIMTR